MGVLQENVEECPYHGFPEWMQAQTFYNGSTEATRLMIDITARGTPDTKKQNEALELFEAMAMDGCQWSTARAKPTKAAGLCGVVTITALATLIAALNRKVDGLTASPSALVMSCDTSGGGC